MNSKLLASALLFLAASSLPAQSHPHGPAKPPAKGPAPLLYVRFVSPAAMRVTAYTGGPAGFDFTAPVQLGLRPGYSYRVRLSNLPGHPGAAVYPTLEVRGTLHLPPGMNAADYPAPVTIAEDDLRRVAAGGLVTKVVYLEHPELSPAVATKPDEPLETELRPTQDLWNEARHLGRPLLVIRLGARTLEADQLARLAIPNTVLLPGEKVLGQPAAPPCIPWTCWPVYDPIHGPRHPEEECLHDGGDISIPAALDAAGRLRGLDPTDTVAEYADSHGRRKLAISNRICLCVPRFALLWNALVPVGYEQVAAAGSAEAPRPPVVLPTRQFVYENRQAKQLLATLGSKRPSETENVTIPLGVDVLQGNVEIVGQMAGQTIVGVCPKVDGKPDKPLILHKAVDPKTAKVGDVVTFTLRYGNSGGQPIADVAISDSLTGRLEYVPGSWRADRPALFTLRQNEAGSVVLRWEVRSALPPGESGVITFQARVR